MLPREYINYNDKLYWIYRKVKQNQIKEGFVQDIKTYWNCDVVVKHRNQNDDLLLFLIEIPEVYLDD
jgi:hypothetical protein